MMSVLRQRNFRLLWSAGFISLLGDWFLYTCFPFYIALTTGSTLATGLMALTELLPTLLFGAIAGVLIDRWNPKKTMMVADLLRAAVLVVLLVAPSSTIFWSIYVVAFIEASISVFFDAAKVVMIKMIIETEELVPANSLSTISDNIARLTGSVLAGGLFLFLGLHFLIVIDSLSYLISALLLTGMVLPLSLSLARENDSISPEPTSKERCSFTTFWHQWLEGLHYLRQERWLVVLMGCLVASMLSQGMINALYALFAVHVVGMNSEAFGWYLGLQGIGGFLGGLLVGKFGKLLRPIQLLAFSLAGCSLLFFLQVNFPFLPVALATIAIAGIFVVGWIVSLQTLLQSGVKKALLGRTITTYRTFQTGAVLVGTSGGSIIGALWGIVPTLNLAAGLFLLAALGCFLFRRSFESHTLKTEELLSHTGV